MTYGGVNTMYDVLIIGAGIIGSAVARELSRYNLKIGVLEKELDVCVETTGRNTGVLHAGFTYKPGSLKAQCCVEGNAEFDKIAEELKIPFKRLGKVVVGFTDEDKQSLLKYQDIGRRNGVPGLRLIDKKELKDMAPDAGGEFAMYSPTSGILSPFIYNVALAENAKQNGVTFYFDTEVVGQSRNNNYYILKTTKGNFSTRWVVNCAGLHSSKISTMLGIPGYKLGFFKGEYYVLDKNAGRTLNMLIYPAPGPTGGFATHATPTVDGNVLIGPDSVQIDCLDNYENTKSSMDKLFSDGRKMFKNMKREYCIRNFSGIRPKLIDPETKDVLDFVIERRDTVPHVVNLVGIESPGLTCALPIARRVIKCIKEVETLYDRKNFNPCREEIICFANQSREVQQQLIEMNPDYGEIICRCETVTKAEILQAIHNPLGVNTMTAIKNRVRAMMGRCQGGYCQMRIAELIQEELHKKETEIMYGRKKSHMFTGKVR